MNRFYVTSIITLLALSFGLAASPLTTQDEIWLRDSQKRALLDNYLNGPAEQPQKAPSGAFYTIYLSESMGEARINQALALVRAFNANGGQARIVFRGMLPHESFGDAMRRLVQRIKKTGMESVPVQIDPTAFRRHKIAWVPTIVRVESGAPTDRVEGTFNPNYIVNRREQTQDRSGAFVDYPREGDVYEIAEVDLIEHMQKQLTAMDWDEKRRDAMKRYWTRQQFIQLPPAERDQSYSIDPTIVVDEDFYLEGRLIHVKGTRLSPFDHVPMVKRYLVFNASRPAEVTYAKQMLSGSQGGDWMLIASEFPEDSVLDDVMALQDEIQGAIYLLDEKVRERFKVKATPTLIEPDSKKKVFRVTEVAL